MADQACGGACFRGSVVVWTFGVIGCVFAGCNPKPPPGAEAVGVPSSTPVVFVRAAPPGDPPAPPGHQEGKTRASGPELGAPADNLPFTPTKDKLASLAWRTWVYTDTGPRRTRYGYLRAGAVVPRRGPPIVNEGCAGGWWRINPRGFVCIGKGATTDIEHPLVRSLSVRARRGHGLPYLYSLSRETPPHLYFRLPTKAEMRETESRSYLSRAADFRSGVEQKDWWSLLKFSPEVPGFLLGGSALEKPYGVERRLHYSVHAGKASADSG